MEEIERGSGISLWRQIEQTLLQEISAGVLRPGDKLPTEQELSARFEVNRHTVRRAVAALVQRGIVSVTQGRGSFVQEEIIDYPIGKRTRFSENLKRQNRSPGGSLIRSEQRPATALVAKNLEISPGTPVLLLELLSNADGVPISKSQHFFPWDRFAAMAEGYEETHSITKALARCGVADYTRKQTNITARLPSSEEARLLRQTPGRPILHVESVNLDESGVPIQFSIVSFAGDRVQMVVEN